VLEYGAVPSLHHLSSFVRRADRTSVGRGHTLKVHPSLHSCSVSLNPTEQVPRSDIKTKTPPTPSVSVCLTASLLVHPMSLDPGLFNEALSTSEDVLSKFIQQDGSELEEIREEAVVV